MGFEKKALLIISFFLLIINVYVISAYSVNESRIMRLISSIIYLLLFLFFKGYKNKAIFTALICFMIANVFMVFYENPIANKLTSLFSISGYLVFITYLYKRIKLVRVNKYLAAFFAFLVLLNVYGLYQLFNIIEYKLHDNLQQVIFYVYGLVVIILCALAGNYNFRHNTRKSMFYMYFVFGFALSDFCAVTAYYYNFDLLYYLDRPLYLFAIFFIVRYAIRDYKKDERFLFNDL